ncbi:hypothetical protein AKJ63_01550 [candidate division MSBL1 archaeon SCGC-AAA259D18]|uniref:Serpin domain-containing protein n=1 Tax=candidate division MSBL1 archaeon SCGC-AAA259D18 TaxID=1698262 RepID=A0A133UB10_9EURY|nr:hypothetical protein AKJ63_01550 [candidate division MSBL1 archaeon SCGC-AAA259D18]
MSSAFGPGENFSGMSPLGKELFVQKVVHKAYVKVDEKGTEAAAVTAVVIEKTAISPKPSFVANRPFMFLVKDEKTGSILFMDSVANPGIFGACHTDTRQLSEGRIRRACCRYGAGSKTFERSGVGKRYSHWRTNSQTSDV